jgi:hypothetical protein
VSEKEALSADAAKRTGGSHLVSKEKCNVLLSIRKTKQCKEKEKKVSHATN